MGREPKGIVKPEEYDDLRKRIVEELGSAVDEEGGRKVMEGVYSREDIYWGPYTKNSHDIILTPDCECTLSDRIKDKIIRKNKKAGSSHQRDGILILCGPGIKKAKKITGAHIMDVAPTILYLLDLPVPKSFDGKVLTEIFEPDILKAHPIRVEDIPLEAESTEFVMGRAEEEEIKKRLGGLGYFE
jgi:predicted AlkP superfamily phosphohydrolase/phosphomutase